MLPKVDYVLITSLFWWKKIIVCFISFVGLRVQGFLWQQQGGGILDVTDQCK